ncbi:response regulator [Fulvivirga sp. 29W222]|uniref:Response regulator n=1 Tax=Fulvivirga marina TaxID=2494733 RepID=A0A937FWH1_9BACT|nr:response regulator [Fulvivirga marina]MBL6447294.1 response regulator [Fulvivirga marina]
MNLISNIKVAIVEDDQYYAETLKAYIQNHLVKAGSNITFDIKHYSSAEECINGLEKSIDIIILDYNLENTSMHLHYSGEELLNIINGFCRDCQVIIVSGQKDQDVAIELFRIGIYEYIEKDNDTLIRLSSTLKRAIKDKILDHYI